MADNKICVACGEDCSNTKRVKDKQGRYICGACLEKRKAKKKASGDGAATGAAAMLLADLPQNDPNAVLCEGCGMPIKPEQVICTKCGRNQQSGKVVKTSVAKHAPGEGAGAKAAKASFEVAAPVIGAAGGLVGGLIGAGIWAGIAYTTGYEISWLAWGVGALVGGGTLLASGGRAGVIGGVYAAVIALLAVAGGRYAAFSMMSSNFVEEAQTMSASTISYQDMEAWIVDEIAVQWIDEGRRINWQNGTTLEDAEYPGDYPADLRLAASAYVDSLTREQQNELRQEMETVYRSFDRAMADVLTEQAFADSFGLVDIVFGLLALITAFKLAGIEGE